jgi:hypothetical protein
MQLRMADALVSTDTSSKSMWPEDLLWSNDFESSSIGLARPQVLHSCHKRFRTKEQARVFIEEWCKCYLGNFGRCDCGTARSWVATIIESLCFDRCCSHTASFKFRWRSQRDSGHTGWFESLDCLASKLLYQDISRSTHSSSSAAWALQISIPTKW